MKNSLDSPSLRQPISFFCTVVYLLCFSLRFLTDLPKSVSGILFFLGGCVPLLYVFCKGKGCRKWISVVLIVDAVALINAAFNGNGGINDVLYVLAAQSFGFFLYMEKEQMKTAAIILLVVFFYIAFRVLFFPKIDSFGGIGVAELCGKNAISVVMMFAYAVDLLYRKQQGKRPDYVLPLIGILISLVTDSSGGILGFTVIILGLLCCKNANRIAWLRVLFGCAAGMGLLIVTGLLPKVIAFLTDDNSRFTIWEMYLNLAFENLKGFLCGGTFSNNETLNYYKNIHNNFLNWHCFFGLLPMIAYFVIVVRSGIIYLKRKEWYLLVIWVALFIRSMTDGTDYCFMSIWMYMYLDVTMKKNG